MELQKLLKKITANTTVEEVNSSYKNEINKGRRNNFRFKILKKFSISIRQRIIGKIYKYKNFRYECL